MVYLNKHRIAAFAASMFMLATATSVATENSVDQADVTAPATIEQSDAAADVSPAVLAAVKDRFEARFPGIVVTQVHATPLAGIYEVRIGMDLVYADAQVEYVLQGALINAVTRTDLTAQRLTKLTEVAFDSLPLDSAIKQVKGTGARQIAVFEDPNCGYCKQLHQTLEGVDDITVYTLLFPILSPDSHTKARDIWCAHDQVATWRAWMLDKKIPPTAECETPIEDILALGRSLMVRGTPAIIFSDGSRVNGAMPLDQFVEKLETIGPSS